MKTRIRDYEEIVSLQDKAIEALTQANAALVMALEALKKARAEHGFPVQLPGLGLGQVNGIPAGGYANPTYIPTPPQFVPGIAPQWSNGGL